ncbi:MAG: DUF2207 domain-containing protein [Treponema sp.]|nr:DUF2207 domain-containing protein [Treponema sp.]
MKKFFLLFVFLFLASVPIFAIYRSFPEKFYYYNQEEEREMTYVPKYTSIKTYDDKHKNENKDGTFSIVIGDKNKTVIGNHTYVISYDCQIPDDRIELYDFLYYSPLGAFWNTKIDNFEFEIKFQKPIPDNSQLEVFSGEAGVDKNPLNIDCKIDSYGIHGKAINIPPRNAITVYVHLPEGYFVGARKVSPVPAWIFAIISIAILTYSLFLCIFSVSEKPVRTVEFYPPDGIPPSEVGFIVDHSADDKDILALIPYWAQKGYITLIEEKSKNFGIKETVIEIQKKLKSLKQNLPICAIFYSLFDTILQDNNLPPALLIIVFAMYVAFCIFNGRLIKMTPYNVEITGKLLGLKDFIKFAEMPRLKVLLDDNPEYFYDVLPYAIVFGLEDEWIKRFKDITVKEPAWYSGNVSSINSFTTTHLVNSLGKRINSQVKAVRSQSESSGGSGSRFHGHSGGGGGGGGGGSW